MNIIGDVDDGETVEAEDLTKYEEACAALGVSLKEVKNGALSLRDPIEILRELAAAYKDLPEGDIRAANLLSSVGGKLRANYNPYVQKCA